MQRAEFAIAMFRQQSPMRQFELYRVDLGAKYSVTAGKQGVGHFCPGPHDPYLHISHLPYNNTSMM